MMRIALLFALVLCLPSVATYGGQKMTYEEAKTGICPG